MRDINELLNRFSYLVPANGGRRLPDCPDCQYSEYRKYLFHIFSLFSSASSLYRTIR